MRSPATFIHAQQLRSLCILENNSHGKNTPSTVTKAIPPSDGNVRASVQKRRAKHPAPRPRGPAAPGASLQPRPAGPAMPGGGLPPAAGWVLSPGLSPESASRPSAQPVPPNSRSFPRRDPRPPLTHSFPPPDRLTDKDAEVL